MIKRTNGPWDWSLIRRIKENRYALTRRRVDDLMDFRRAGPVQETSPTPFVRDEINEPPIHPLTIGETSGEGADLSMTDETILGLVHCALHASGYQQLRNLQAYCHDGRVTLQGQLPTYYLKQIAQSVIRSSAGVLDIDNDVKVVISW